MAEAKVRLAEMTWREAEAYLKERDIAILPTGPVEGHGPHVPMGCDAYVAEAVGLALARKVRGVLLPSLCYNYSGATAMFKGTVSVPMEAQIVMTKAIIRALWRTGFRRIAIISVRGPNGMPIGNAVRTIFEEDGIPALYMNPWGVFDEEKLRARAQEFESGYKEATLAYGAMKLLGKSHAIPDAAKLADRLEEAASHPLPEPLRKLQRFGSVGYHYNHELQHIPPRSGIDPDLGVELIERAAETLAPAFDHLADYLRHLQEHPRKFVE